MVNAAPESQELTIYVPKAQLKSLLTMPSVGNRFAPRFSPRKDLLAFAELPSETAPPAFPRARHGSHSRELRGGAAAPGRSSPRYVWNCQGLNAGSHLDRFAQASIDLLKP